MWLYLFKINRKDIVKNNSKFDKNGKSDTQSPLMTLKRLMFVWKHRLSTYLVYKLSKVCFFGVNLTFVINECFMLDRLSGVTQRSIRPNNMIIATDAMEMIWHAIIPRECLAWSQENVSRKLMGNFLFAKHSGEFWIMVYLQGITINCIRSSH